MGSKIEEKKKWKSALKEDLPWILLAIVVLLVGALGLHMSILLNQRMGPEGITGRASFVREIRVESVSDRNVNCGEVGKNFLQ